MTRGRRAINKFSIIEDETWHSFHKEAEISDVINKYYQSLFTSVAQDREEIVNQALSLVITPEVNARLISVPSPDKLRTSVFSIHSDKASGLDGFSTCFFQSNWETVGPTIIDEIQEFFSTGTIPNNINHTHVRLIPRVQSPKKVANYRPIALCNVYYNIVSKILTRRLPPILDDIISKNQSAFVPGRSITDNVLITHEVLHYLKTSGANKHCSMAVKTDMSKAYDRVEWDFVWLVFKRLGFDDKWTTFISQCISTVTYSFLINGTTQGYIKPSCGIHQGDPLSPYLFILCGKVLSGLFKNVQVNGRLKGIRVAQKSPRVNHLLFDDDTIFFCKSNKEEFGKLMHILTKYEIASGQKMNGQKSSITFSSKTSKETKKELKGTFWFLMKVA